MRSISVVLYGEIPPVTSPLTKDQWSGAVTFLCWQTEHAFEQTVDLSVVWDAMTPKPFSGPMLREIYVDFWHH